MTLPATFIKQVAGSVGVSRFLLAMVDAYEIAVGKKS